MPRSLQVLRQSDSGQVSRETPVPPAKRAELRDHGLLPSALDTDALAQCALNRYRVAVVGGGFAGLVAGWYLERMGIRTTVFEASDHVGGRVLTDPHLVPGKIVEAGAELIGSNHPMWWELGSDFGLSLVEVTSSQEYKRAACGCDCGWAITT